MRGIQLGWTSQISVADWANPDPAAADTKLASLAWLGNYAASNPTKFHNLYLGHEVLEQWNRAKRREIRKRVHDIAKIPLAKQHAYVGTFLNWFARGDDPHARGGTWSEYMLGGEEEIAILSFNCNSSSTQLEAEISMLRASTRRLDPIIYTHINVNINDPSPRDRVRSKLAMCDRFGVDVCLVRVTNAAGVAPQARPWPTEVFEGIRDYR